MLSVDQACVCGGSAAFWLPRLPLRHVLAANILLGALEFSMGCLLVLTTVSEEACLASDFRDSDDLGRSFTLAERYPPPSALSLDEQLAAHPWASIEVGARNVQIWRLPPEPPPGSDWHRDPVAVARQSEVVRADLEAFLNRELGKLQGKMRSGWWMFGKVQVRVELCETVAEREVQHG